MKLFEEFKLYENLWEDLPSENEAPKTDGTPEFEILYKVSCWDPDEVYDTQTYADDEAEAEESFWEWILEKDDTGEQLDQKDVTIVSIKPTGKFY